jgi:hypothetical protein
MPKVTDEYFETGLKKGRGMAQASLDLIDAMYDAAAAAQPITGRGIGYKLFAAGLIPSMKTNSMQKVYRLLRIARENGTIPWEWIVDETRELEQVSTWSDPDAYLRCVARSYRRDFWQQQPVRVEVWSEKGTVRGVLQPILDKYGVGFRVMHGFGSATSVYDVAQGNDLRILVALYVGDFDPSGMYMSECDLLERLKKYGGWHVELRRVALNSDDPEHLETFPASDKRYDPRYEWFVETYGDECCELDAMDPNDLRRRVERAIKRNIEPEAWKRWEKVNKAEIERHQLVPQWLPRQARVAFQLLPP